jgi:hypothetical protein
MTQIWRPIDRIQICPLIRRKTSTEYCRCETDYELWKKLEDNFLSSYLVGKYAPKNVLKLLSQTELENRSNRFEKIKYYIQ